MIYYKVPQFNDGVVKLARQHEHSDMGEMSRLYNQAISRQRPDTKADKKWPDRQRDIQDLVHLYSYFNDTKADDPAYNAYRDTLDKMLNHNGIIPTKDSALPLSQFVSKSIEPLALEALSKSEFNHDSILNQGVEGKQDYGVDATIQGSNIDVKTTFHKGNINGDSLLGMIKSYALNDPTKKTDHILWTGNCIEQGYIALKGAEKWSDVKEQIGNKEGWSSGKFGNFDRGRNGKSNPLVFYRKNMKDLDSSKLFNVEFIGDFNPKQRENIEAANLWTFSEHSFRGGERIEIGKLLIKAKELMSKDPKSLTDEEVIEVDKVVGELRVKHEGYINKKGVLAVGRDLYQYRKTIETPKTVFLSKTENVIDVLSKRDVKTLTDKDKEAVLSLGREVKAYSEAGYKTNQCNRVLSKTYQLHTKIKENIKEQDKSAMSAKCERGEQVSPAHKKEQSRETVL